jgi:hypothetical protein
VTGPVPPETDRLYHYTNLTGLLGILEQQRIFASDCRFVNDPRELRYGVETVGIPVFDKFGQTGSDPELVSSYIEGLERFLSPGSAPFLACFSTEGDQLSQWRGYGSESTVVSLGFSASALSEGLVLWNPGRSLRLLPVIYDEARAKAAFREVIPQKDGQLFRIPSGSGNLMATGHMYDVAITCKHPGFREESEWRIIASRVGLGVPEIDLVDVRLQNGRLVPYIEVALGNEDSPMPLEEIRFFPGADPDGGVRAGIEAALSKAGMEHVSVLGSTIPYRP